jgi:hypothetical protein
MGPEVETMTQDFDAAEERARLAAADLSAAADAVIRRYTITWQDAQDEVDFAELSRWTRYYPDPKLDDARDDLGFANRTLANIATISASLSELATGRSETLLRPKQSSSAVSWSSPPSASDGQSTSGREVKNLYVGRSSGSTGSEGARSGLTFCPPRCVCT